MKWMAICSAPVAVAGGMYLHGPLMTNETYARTPDEAAWVLQTMQTPPGIENMISSLPQGSVSKDFVPGKSATWYFFARGGQAAKFVAQMTPVDATHTRISTRLTMSGDAETLMTTEFMPMAKQFASVGAAAMQEQIDSKMERRSFDKNVVNQAMAGYAMANMGEIQQSASAAMDKAAARFDDDDADRARRASGVSFVPGQPMIDPGKPSR